MFHFHSSLNIYIFFAEETFSPVAAMDGNNAFGEDMLQMALKMATEYEDQPVDLESAMTANTITPSSHPGMPGEFSTAFYLILAVPRGFTRVPAKLLPVSG